MYAYFHFKYLFSIYYLPTLMLEKSSFCVSKVFQKWKSEVVGFEWPDTTRARIWVAQPSQQARTSKFALWADE